MAYTGQTIPIPIASGGLLTDVSPDQIPAKNLIGAENVLIRDGILQKAPGAIRWNNEVLDSGIVALIDYWPTAGKQYTIVVTREGKVWRFSDRFTKIEITPTTDQTFISMTGEAPASLSVTERVHICIGGNEYVDASENLVEAQPKKVFIFTGNNPVQVIYGEETERHNLLQPSIDWNGDTSHQSYPTFGIIYVNRLFVTGVSSNPNMVYASSDLYGGTPDFLYGHEDFSEDTFNSPLFNVYPGDGEQIKSLFKYKTKLWCVKYPRGLMSLEIPDIGTPNAWYFQKVNDDVGTPSISGVCAVLDDAWVMNSAGTIQSLSATLNLGGVTASDVLKNLHIERYVQSQTSPLGIGERFAIWHEQKNTAYFLFRSLNSNLNNYLLVVDFTSPEAKVTVYDMLQPNVLAIRRDVVQKEEMIYGCEDGFIYVMDQNNRLVGDQFNPYEQTAYTGSFQTPHMMLHASTNQDFNLASEADKNFDFVEIEYIPTGEAQLFVDVYIDGRKTETIFFILNRSNELDHFVLDLSRLQGRSTRRQRKAIHGRGRTVSLRFYNSELNDNFKITGLTIYARINGQNAKGGGIGSVPV